LPPSVSRSLTRAAVGSDVGGMGALFPLLLVGSLLVAAVFRFVIRGRR
jgi:hypothetical protein